jgi:hypothetical protein
VQKFPLLRYRPDSAGVALGMDPHQRFEREALGRRGDLERFVVDPVLARAERAPVDRQRERLEPLPRQHERGGIADHRCVAVDREPRAHQRLVLAQVEVEIDGFDPIVGRPIVAAIDDLRLLGAHFALPPCSRW